MRVTAAGILVSTFAAFASQAAAGSIHVDANYAGGSNDGSQDHPYTTIGEAISAATGGDNIYVAEGAYVETIIVSNGVSMYGGYQGVGDWSEGNRTPRSSLIQGDGGGNGSTQIVAVTASGARLDGFEISNHENVPSATGSTVYGVKVTAADCVIYDNLITGLVAGAGVDASGSAGQKGGAAYGIYSTAPVAVLANTITGIAAGNGGDSPVGQSYQAGAGGSAAGVHVTGGNGSHISTNALALITGGDGGDMSAHASYCYAGKGGDARGIEIESSAGVMLAANDILSLLGGDGGKDSDDYRQFAHDGGAADGIRMIGSSGNIDGCTIDTVTGGKGGTRGDERCPKTYGGTATGLRIETAAGATAVTKNEVSNITGGIGPDDMRKTDIDGGPAYGVLVDTCSAGVTLGSIGVPAAKNTFIAITGGAAGTAYPDLLSYGGYGGTAAGVSLSSAFNVQSYDTQIQSVQGGAIAKHKDGGAADIIYNGYVSGSAWGVQLVQSDLNTFSDTIIDDVATGQITGPNGYARTGEAAGVYLGGGDESTDNTFTGTAISNLGKGSVQGGTGELDAGAKRIHSVWLRPGSVRNTWDSSNTIDEKSTMYFGNQRLPAVVGVARDASTVAGQALSPNLALVLIAGCTNATVSDTILENALGSVNDFTWEGNQSGAPAAVQGVLIVDSPGVTVCRNSIRNLESGLGNYRSISAVTPEILAGIQVQGGSTGDVYGNKIADLVGGKGGSLQTYRNPAEGGAVAGVRLVATTGDIDVYENEIRGLIAGAGGGCINGGDQNGGNGGDGTGFILDGAGNAQLWNNSVHDVAGGNAGTTDAGSGGSGGTAAAIRLCDGSHDNHIVGILAHHLTGGDGSSAAAVDRYAGNGGSACGVLTSGSDIDDNRIINMTFAASEGGAAGGNSGGGPEGYPGATIGVRLARGASGSASSDNTVVNCIIEAASFRDRGIHSEEYDEGACTLDYNNIYGNGVTHINVTPGAHTVCGDPDINDFFTPSQGAEAVDAGSDAWWNSAAFGAMDVYGNPRRAGAAIDMGACERSVPRQDSVVTLTR